ncbi:S46 family peptidase [Bacteroidota bacterium]
MKRLFIVLIAFLAIGVKGFTSTPPDEGMWLPIFVERLNYVDMEKMGLQLTAEEIYSINSSSLKDAIVGLSRGSTPRGFFCTGEIVSDKGLIFTNHHCGYNYIQKHSTIAHDYLADGFWAESYDEELENPGMSATFFREMEDVTDSIIPFLSDTMTEGQRSTKVGEIMGKLKKRASEDGKYHVVIKGFFGGNEYYLFVYEVYTDIRLVGAPPSSVGKFGGDTDNWMWPRHTGDFSIFRVYTAPDGSAADFAKENVPMTPKHHLPVSVAGYEKGDFAMIWGYPGGTDRYLTSYGINFNLEHYNPNIIKILGAKLEVWKKYMDADPKVKIQYASKYAGSANGWKYYIGQDRGLKKLDVYGQKQELEKRFQKWVNADPERKEKYGDVLENYKEAYEEMGKDFKKLIYTALAANGAEILGFARGYGQLAELLEQKTDEAIVTETTDELKESSAAYFKNYNEAADENVMAAMFKIYYEDMPHDFLPVEFTNMVKKYKEDFTAMAADIFENSVFSNQEKVDAFLAKPKAKTIEKDPAYILSNAFIAKLGEARGGYGAATAKLAPNDRLFIDGLRKMDPDKVFYPDANSTMRLSYGTVEPYKAADAVYYDYVTTLAGVMEKEDPNNDEFIVEEKLKELYKNKDFGQYASIVNGEETVVTCFLTTHDITGGNSGSPVINAKGELIGLAFDGNWEAMSGDIAFAPELQRTINVDVRYVLFIIDKYAGAQRLIDELDIVTEPVKKPCPVKAEVTETVVMEETPAKE